MSQVPLSVIVAWIMGIKMDLDFNLLETACLALSILVTAFTLQVIWLNTIFCMDSHYYYYFYVNKIF